MQSLLRINITATLLGLIALLATTNGQTSRVRRICVTNKFADQCSQLQRGNSDVVCQIVQDSIECAHRIRNGTAHFGVFTAESALQIATIGLDDMVVIKELRHRDRATMPVDFESVAIVRSTHTTGIEGLRGLNFCHPGYFYDRTQRWSERFLKHFERNIVPITCPITATSPATIEAAALNSFFNSSCRPGIWSHNKDEDTQLKKQFPSLCALCNADGNSCNYLQATGREETTSRSQQALNCMRFNGDVTYVSLESARTFFIDEFSGIAQNYAYLCPNGSTQVILNNERPCTWLRQPWRMIISNNAQAIDLSSRINIWMNTVGTGGWEDAFHSIITADSYVIRNVDSIQSPREYIRSFREIPIPADFCSTTSTWCTTSIDERDKCEAVRAGGLSTGVLPLIECRTSTAPGVTNCLADISGGRADFMGIDSNFGYLARHPNNLTAALYVETETEKYSTVGVLIKNNAPFERFENLRNSKACIPEFGGIASIAFINMGKSRGFLASKSCEYSQLLGNFFGDSCVPGSRNPHNDPRGNSPESLCRLCLTNVMPATINRPIMGVQDLDIEVANVPSDENIIEGTMDAASVPSGVGANCAPDDTNRFYGNRGALRCLAEVGDVAVIELQNLKDHAATLGLNPTDFRVMCRNGTLAANPGFDVDDDCVLTMIVDGEVVVRRNSAKTPGIINALISFDQYFLHDPDFHMYDDFNGATDLLFKDTTLGLISPNDTNLDASVQNYINLFENVETCSDGNGAANANFNNFMTIIIMAYVALVFNK